MLSRASNDELLRQVPLNEMVGAGARCLAQAEAARAPLRTEGWEACPHWHELTGGILGPPNPDVGLGDWPYDCSFFGTNLGRSQHLACTRDLTFANLSTGQFAFALDHFLRREECFLPAGGGMVPG